jgi:glucose-6-phosphate dehydrogenase assembly protein OpcA
MTTLAESAPADSHTLGVPLQDVERALAQQLKLVQGQGELPAHKARMSNIVVYCTKPEQAVRVSNEIPAIVTAHPARVILLVGEAPEGTPAAADVSVWCQVGSHQRNCSEQVTVWACAAEADRLPFVVRSLLIGDLPINVWWATPSPPPLAGPLLYDLAENAQQVIYDSLGWANPHRGVAATAAWLAKFERGSGGHWRVASDLNWRRLKYWRRILTQAFDPTSNPGALDSITEFQIEHGPHAVTQAWQLVGWMASRLHWRVQTGRVQPGVALDWNVKHLGGSLRLRIVRRPEGASAILSIKISCQLQGKPATLNFAIEEGRRLSVTAEGSDLTTRTVALQPQSMAEMVARQLSDRERDRVFAESMAVAQVFAESVLR